jgi:uncharacterized MnhB-related membrane protein
MNPAPSVKPQTVSPLQVARIIWLMFIGSLGLIIAMALTLMKTQPRSSPDLTFTYAIAGVAVAQLVFLGAFRSRLLGSSRTQSDHGEEVVARQRWVSAQVLGFASAEAVVLFGFVLHTMNARPPWVSTALFVTGVLLMVAFFPQRQEPLNPKR